MPKAATRFIQPDVLSRISSLELLARGVVEGFISGLHRSPYKGFSVEFMSYRPYIPGDDPLRLDWKLFARTDRLYVKEFEDETNTRLNILVDISHSMGYGSGAVSKLEYGFFLAAALAHLIIRQRDAVGMALFDDKIVRQIPAKSSTRHLQTMMKMMEEAELGEKTALGKPLHELADQHRKRGFVVLISDLLDDPEAIIDGLRHFRFGGHEVLVFHIMDPQEVAFEFTDFVEFEDLETGETLLVSADAAREIYLENLEGFHTRLQEACGQLGVDYNRLTTDQPLDHALFNYLASRKRKA
jgi:uncharacterized protein (DUF58 family)